MKGFLIIIFHLIKCQIQSNYDIEEGLLLHGALSTHTSVITVLLDSSCWNLGIVDPSKLGRVIQGQLPKAVLPIIGVPDDGSDGRDA